MEISMELSTLDGPAHKLIAELSEDQARTLRELFFSSFGAIVSLLEPRAEELRGLHV